MTKSVTRFEILGGGAGGRRRGAWLSTCCGNLRNYWVWVIANRIHCTSLLPDMFEHFYLNNNDGDDDKLLKCLKCSKE